MGLLNLVRRIRDHHTGATIDPLDRGLLTDIGRPHNPQTFRDIAETVRNETVKEHDIDTALARLEDNTDWLDDLTERLPMWQIPTDRASQDAMLTELQEAPDHRPLAWDDPEPTVQLAVQRMYDGPTCRGCGTPAFADLCAVCSSKANG